MNRVLHPLGRSLVALIFVLSGAGKLMNFGATASMMGAAGFPVPELFLAGAIAFEILGGLALALGFRTRLASLALIVFLIPATLIFHAGHLSDPGQAQTQMVEVLKNLAILGALIRFVANGPGRLAFDHGDRSRSEFERQVEVRQAA
ncbi:MAG: DoxX family protein [Acidobacteriota bacterium]